MSAAPLWLRWVVALAVAAGVSIALVRYVDTHNSDSEAPISPAAVQAEDREAEALEVQDQTPHTAPVPAGTAAALALKRAITQYMAHQIATGVIGGPLNRSSCTRTSAGTAARIGFSCEVVAGSVRYPFLAVAEPARRRVTFCKRDLPPVPSANVPVSYRCRV